MGRGVTTKGIKEMKEDITIDNINKFDFVFADDINPNDKEDLKAVRNVHRQQDSNN